MDQEKFLGKLREALTFSAAELRVAAIQVAGGMGTWALPAVPDLVEALYDSDRKVRKATAVALTRITSVRESVLPNLISRSIAGDHAVRMANVNAIIAFGRTAIDAVPALLQILGNEQESNALRVTAVLALEQVQDNSQPVVQALCRATTGPEELCEAALYALRLLGTSAAETVPAICLQLSQAKSSKIRYIAAEILQKMFPPDLSAIPGLLIGMRDSEFSVRVICARALGNFGAEAKAAIPLLQSALQDKYQVVRSAAEEAIARINS